MQEVKVQRCSLVRKAFSRRDESYFVLRYLQPKAKDYTAEKTDHAICSLIRLTLN